MTMRRTENSPPVAAIPARDNCATSSGRRFCVNDPRNRVFYTIHVEGSVTPADAVSETDVVAGPGLSGYEMTPAIPSPTANRRLNDIRSLAPKP